MKNIFLAPVLVLVTILSFTSCSRIDTTDLGNELIPAVDNINTFDTVMNVTSDNVLMADSTRMFGSFTHAIGIIDNDPEFGKTEASLFASFAPTGLPSYPFVKRDTVKIDSIVLSLTFDNLYGDSLSVQKFEVFEISTTSGFKDSAYRITIPEFNVLPTPIGNRQFTFTALNDSVFYKNPKDTVRTRNELRIHLDTAFGRRFINYDTTNAYKTDSAFKTYFSGLAIKASESSPNKKGLAYFTLGSSTRLTFYCRVSNNGVQDTIARAFAFGASQANPVKRTPGNGYLAALNNANPNDDKVYIQATPGSMASIKIPGLENVSNRVIHRAELIVEKLPSLSDNIFTTPAILFLDAINANGDSTFAIPKDFIPNQTDLGYEVGLLGGTLRNNRYAFNITRYVQGIVTFKRPNYNLRLYAPLYTYPFYVSENGTVFPLQNLLTVNPNVAKGRVVVGGGSHPTNKMRLRIIYSKI